MCFGEARYVWHCRLTPCKLNLKLRITKDGNTWSGADSAVLNTQYSAMGGPGWSAGSWLRVIKSDTAAIHWQTQSALVYFSPLKAKAKATRSAFNSLTTDTYRTGSK